jgi:hypothetical protein
MFEHHPHQGPDYFYGIEGNKILIVGNSHWLSKGEADHADITRQVVENVTSGKWRISFFSRIMLYFGFSNHDDFWRRVAFINYVPGAIGIDDERYNHIRSGADVEHARERFLRVIRDLKPDFVLIFSKKIRWALPALETLPLAGGLPDAHMGLLKEGDHTATVFLLRHPQGARSSEMVSVIQSILSHRTAA